MTASTMTSPSKALVVYDPTPTPRDVGMKCLDVKGARDYATKHPGYQAGLTLIRHKREMDAMASRIRDTFRVV
jgi:hypothetical protein